MYIDLTHRLNNQTPVFPGDPSIKISDAASFDTKGNLGHELRLGTHSGTHIDAPAHMIPGSKTLDKFDVSNFVGKACYVLLENKQFTLSLVKNAPIKSGDIVIFNTQMSHKFKDPEYFTDYPVMTEEVAQYLVDKKVKMVGVDACSIDNTSGFPIHKILLGSNIPVIENLTNIEQLSGHDATIYALPLKLDLDGAPARIIAEVS